jgi:hypothetical protein
LDRDKSLSVLESLQKNKTGLQIILHLLSEWYVSVQFYGDWLTHDYDRNNLEIQL